MSHIHEKFALNPMAKNTDSIMEYYELEHESQVQLYQFWVNIEHGSHKNGNFSTTVGDGKYKSALLLCYLADYREVDIIGKKQTFIMDDDLRKIVRDFYGQSLCDDAVNNPKTTKHKTIRDLLSDGIVTVTLELVA